MLEANRYSTFDFTITHARVLVGIELIYFGIRRHFRRTALFSVAVIIVFPISLFLGYWFRRKRKALQKRMRKEYTQFDSANDYAQFKSKLSELDRIYPSLKRVSDYAPRFAPWPVRFTVTQMKKMSSTVLTYNEWLKGKLDPLNKPVFKCNLKDVKFVPEKELWNNRNPAYQYWL